MQFLLFAMSGHGQPLIFIFFAVVVAAFAIFGYYFSYKRRKELATWAEGKGLSFNQDKIRGIEDSFPSFKSLHQGSNRYAYNVMKGQWGEFPVLCFDYHYQVQSGKNTHHYYFSAAVITSAIYLQPLAIRPEGLLDKVGEFFGLDDIDFESAEFSRKFFVKAADKKWAFDVLHQRTIDFLLHQPTYSIQFDLRYVYVYRSSTFSVLDFEQALETGSGILSRIPEYVVQQQTVSK